MFFKIPGEATLPTSPSAAIFRKDMQYNPDPSSCHCDRREVERKQGDSTMNREGHG